MKRYAVNPAVSLREELDGALLYNPDTDNILLINETGRLIWSFLAKPRTADEIAAHLAANTEGASGVRGDVETFIASLLPDFVVIHD